jgi:transcriptional antiterminator Rof (Rho-off)
MLPEPEPYRPIDCSMHDRLEAAAVRRERVRILWRAPGGEVGETHALIRDIMVRDGAEFLLMNDGTEIRLDWIQTFAGDRDLQQDQR